MNNHFPTKISNKKTFPVKATSFLVKKNQAIEATAELNRKIIHILNSITDAFVSCDRTWRITYINKRAEEMFQLQKESFIGRNIWREFPRDVTELLQKRMYASANEHQAMKFDTQWRGEKWLRIHTYPSADGISLYINDITAEKDISQRKDEFISIASHELKTPVTSMKLFMQMLQKRIMKLEDKKSYILLDKMENQINRLTQLLDDLLDVGRIQTGKLVLRREQIDFDSLVKEICTIVQRTTKSHRIYISGKVKKFAIGDKNRLGEVLMNLLSNAIKYSPAAKSVIVTVAEENNQVFVSVKDFGVGIARAMQEKIFKRFFRVQIGEEKYSGLGLGLYISRNIVVQHGGRLWVESTPGKGSTFSFSIPIS